ncbi:MAG TPA: molybdopterin-dependent oxidoreductase [Thermomonas sp.]|nr:molybdopterin-dependent oxidoreductase [Thermomonas sp.]HQY81224.1 molybdopterin-dependent oxidoreductase [Thermomonas sp.]
MKPYRIVGQPQAQLDARDKVTGRARYTDDLRVPNPLHAAILRSPHASARILRIDTRRALALPGVRAVLTGADFERTFGVLPISKDEPALARERVRYVGEPVAAVAAETAEIAAQALALVAVEYAPTPPVLDARHALKPTDDPLHPELKRADNLHKQVEQRFGDPEAAFAAAPIVIEKRFRYAAVTHAFTEPHAVQVEIDGRGNLTVYSATQVPHYVHLALAEVLGIDEHRVRVVKPHLGGGFGGKSDPFPHEMIAAKLALVSGRNVRLRFSREDVFFSHHGRHPTQLTMKLGFDPARGITALTGDILIDGGAYGSFGVVTTYYNGVLLQGPYPVPNFGFRCRRLYTNTPMCGAMRGHGGVNPRFAAEVLMDMALHQAGLDPCQGRIDLLHHANTLTVNEFRITSAGLKRGLEEAMHRSGWREKHGKLPFGKGIGVACGFFISGSALPIHWNERPGSTVRMTLEFDGAITVYSGASDIGQGSDTVLAMMAAEVLGVDLDQVKVVAADTRLTPVDLGSYSSRVTFMAGNAARNAAIRMRRLLVAGACRKLGLDEPVYPAPGPPADFFRQGQRAPDFEADDLGANPDYRDGFAFGGGRIRHLASGADVAWLDAVHAAIEGPGILQTVGNYRSPKLGGTFKGAGAGLSPAYSFTAFIVEVTVDPETGHVRVDKATCAHDCGFALNPLAVRGQIEGCFHMGMGQALMEEVLHEGGAVQNAGFLEYKIPSPFEQPEIDIVLCDSDENEGPFGAKEAGEGPLAPVIPAIANAIFDAVGVRLAEVPLRPDRVLAALRKQAGVA